MKLKEIKDFVSSEAMIGAPEIGANTYINEITLEIYGNRDIEEIYVDHSDHDLIIELKQLKLKEHEQLKPSEIKRC